MTSPETSPYSVSMDSVSVGGGVGVGAGMDVVAVGAGDGVGVVSGTDVVAVGVGAGAGVIVGAGVKAGGCIVSSVVGDGSVTGASASCFAQPDTRTKMARIVSMIASNFFILSHLFTILLSVSSPES